MWKYFKILYSFLATLKSAFISFQELMEMLESGDESMESDEEPQPVVVQFVGEVCEEYECNDLVELNKDFNR